MIDCHEFWKEFNIKENPSSSETGLGLDLPLTPERTELEYLPTESTLLYSDRELVKTLHHFENLDGPEGSRIMTNLSGNFKPRIDPALSNQPLPKTPEIMEEQSTEPEKESAGPDSPLPKTSEAKEEQSTEPAQMSTGSDSPPPKALGVMEEHSSEPDPIFADSQPVLPKAPEAMEKQSNEPDRILQDLAKRLVTRIAFVPFEHIKSVSIVEQADQTVSDYLKALLEKYTKQPWDWWPWNAPRKPLSKDVVRLRWQCVSLAFLFLT
jgi:hypothetical protein